MDFRHMLASAVARRIAYLVVAAVLGLASAWWNTASAQGNDAACLNFSDETQGRLCQTEAAARERAKVLAVNINVRAYGSGEFDHFEKYPGYENSVWAFVKFYSQGQWRVMGRAWAMYVDADPCVGLPPDPFHPGQCLSQEKCLAWNQEHDGISNGTFAFTSNTNTTSCVGGCMKDFSGSTSPVRKGILYQSNGTQVDRYFVSGEYRFNGQMCGPSYTNGTQAQKDTPSKTAEQTKGKTEECTPVSGQTMCRKSNGDLCATASTGRQICWSPHETGSKTDADVVQVKKPGTSNGDPTLSLSNGDTATKTNDVRIQETTTLAGKSRTSDSVISTYKTTSGADAGATQQGQPTSTGGVSTSGSPVPDGSDKDDGEGDSAGGGGTCAAAPTCSGDAINCAVLDQAWRIRCANDKNDNGMTDWLEPKDGDGALPDDGQDGEPGVTEKSIGADLFEMGGFGGSRSCPSLGSVDLGPLGTHSFDDKPWMCDLVAMIRALMYLLAAFVSIRILME